MDTEDPRSLQASSRCSVAPRSGQTAWPASNPFCVWTDPTPTVRAILNSPSLSLAELDAQIEASEHLHRVWSEITSAARDEVTARWDLCLRDIPGPFVVAAFRAWTDHHMPRPHQIAAAARKMMADAALRLGRDEPSAKPSPTRGPVQPPSLEQRIAGLEANLAEHGPNAMIEGMLARARAELARREEGAA